MDTMHNLNGFTAGFGGDQAVQQASPPPANGNGQPETEAGEPAAKYSDINNILDQVHKYYSTDMMYIVHNLFPRS